MGGLFIISGSLFLGVVEVEICVLPQLGNFHGGHLMGHFEINEPTYNSASYFKYPPLAETAD